MNVFRSFKVRLHVILHFVTAFRYFITSAILLNLSSASWQLGNEWVTIYNGEIGHFCTYVGTLTYMFQPLIIYLHGSEHYQHGRHCYMTNQHNQLF